MKPLCQYRKWVTVFLLCLFAGCAYSSSVKVETHVDRPEETVVAFEFKGTSK